MPEIYDLHHPEKCKCDFPVTDFFKCLMKDLIYHFCKLQSDGLALLGLNASATARVISRWRLC